jgi:hypothetical protein
MPVYRFLAIYLLMIFGAIAIAVAQDARPKPSPATLDAIRVVLAANTAYQASASGTAPTTQSALSRFADTNYDASDAINWRISKFPRVDGNIHGQYPVGGVVELPDGVFTISKPIRLYSGVRFRGQGPSTSLKYTGPDAAIIMSGVNHCYVLVEQMQIFSDTGGGIRYTDEMEWGKGDVLRDLWLSTKGQAISMRRKLGDGTVYNATIERIEFRNLGSGAIDARTINGRVTQISMTHNPRADFTPPACGAMLSFEWSASVEQVVAEWNSDTTLIRFADAGQGPGNFAAAGIHMEPAARTDGRIVPVMIIDHSVFSHQAVMFYGTQTCPIVIRNGSKVSAQIVTDGGANAVQTDPSSTLQLSND